MAKQVGNGQLMQKMNRLKVLGFIRRHPDVSRAVIAQGTGLSLASITNITTYLLELGIISESGVESADRVGRKRTLLRFCADRYATVCVVIEDRVAQVLLTVGDINDPHRCSNVRSALTRLLELGVMPIINENDAVSTDEIGVVSTIGENDTLSAIVARLLEADLLILLSDIDGLYTADPRKDANASLIPEVHEITPEIMALADGKGSALSSGGMATKLKAAKICTEAGCDMIIANGAKPALLYDILDGKSVGTRFIAGGKA